MKRKVILITALLLIGTLLFLSFKTPEQGITGGTISAYEYNHTKAICNETNYCQDYIITCNEEKAINQIAITGATIQHSEDWEDPREDEVINNDCNPYY